jgi:hydroxymethylbilane synthase
MSNKDKILKIGTRGSPLAMVQATTVQRLLAEHWPALETEIVVIRTSGDWLPAHGEVRLSEVEGGKGQFAKEIEQALAAGAVDIAVHSMKDMDSHLPQGLVIDHMLPREDVRDAMIVRDDLRGKVSGFIDIPQGARIGTASVRRAAFLLSQRPDLKIEAFRGNVQTRIDKARGGQVDATFLAMAGLNRLGLSAEADVALSVNEMLPAAAQGAVGIEMREGEGLVADMLAPLNCARTVLCVKAERAALKVLDGSCHTPIAAYAVLDEGGLMSLRVQVSSLDGQKHFHAKGERAVGTVEAAQMFGADLGAEIKADAPAEVFE